MKYVVAFLAALAVLCCSPRTAPRAAYTGQPTVAAILLHGDLDFLPAERAAIERATERLAYATAGAVKVRVVWDLDYRTLQGSETNLLLRVESHYPFVLEIDENGTMLGVTAPKAQSVFIVADRVEELKSDLTAVALHEFGHLLGVPHLDVRGALMRPVYAGVLCLSRTDLAAVCQIHRCDTDRTNPC
jgi:hypothetical protein